MEHKAQERYFSSDFLNNTVRYGLLTVGVVGAILSLSSNFIASSELLRSYVIEDADKVCVVLHVILITLILGPARVRPLDTNIHNPTVRACARLLNRQFLWAWRFVWIFFGMIYVLLLFIEQDFADTRPIVDVGNMPTHLLLRQLILNVGDIGSSWAIALCAVYLSPFFIRSQLLPTPEAPIGPEPLRWTRSVTWFFVGCAVLMILSRLFELGLVDRFPYVHWLVDVAIGLISAVAMGMLAGRLDSPFIANWMWVIVLLYVYASIQVFNNVLEGDTSAKVVFLYAAFSLKCVWFIFVSDMFADRRILYYAYESVRAEQERMI